MAPRLDAGWVRRGVFLLVFVHFGKHGAQMVEDGADVGKRRRLIGGKAAEVEAGRTLPHIQGAKSQKRRQIIPKK